MKFSVYSLIYALFFSLCLSASSLTAFGASDYDSLKTPVQSTLQGQVVYVPKGTTAPVILSAPLNLKTSSLGNQVSAVLINGITYNKKTVAQPGSVITGTVVKLKKSKNGFIKVTFNSLRTPQGYNIAINAVFKTNDNTGILRGKDANLAANTKTEVYFTQPVTISAPDIYSH